MKKKILLIIGSILGGLLLVIGGYFTIVYINNRKELNNIEYLVVNIMNL